MIGKGGNEEIISRLDTRIRSGVLFSNINNAVFLRRDVKFRLNCVGVLFSILNAALVSRLDANF